MAKLPDTSSKSFVVKKHVAKTGREKVGGSDAKARSEYDAQSRWWTKTGDEQFRAVSATLGALSYSQRARLRNHTAYARMYGNISALSPYGGSASTLSTTHPSNSSNLASYNVVQIAADTAVSAVAKNRPKPYFLTSGGSYEQQRKARQLNKLVDGVFYQAKMNTLAPMIFRDGLLFDTGVAHVYPNFQSKRIEIDRTLSGELWVDELEASRGDPRQMHYTRIVDKDVLAAQWGDSADIRERIFNSNTFSIEGTSRGRGISNLTTVRESWHLPSGPEAGDGRHVLTLDNGVLNPDPEEQKFTRDHFPFAFFPWSRRPLGFWAQSGVEQAQGMQLSINNKCWYIQRSHQLGGTFKIWIPIGSQIPEETFNNELGSIGYYSGAVPPTYTIPPMVQPELYQQIETEARHIFEVLGVSQMSARGTKPSGLNSGTALREYKDEAEGRLTTPGQNYEQFHVECANLVVEAAQDLKAEIGEFSVSIPGNRFLARVELPANLEEDSYVTQCWPVSSLPSDPAGKLQTIQEYIQAGFMTRRQGRRALSFPDLERMDSLATAAEDYLSMVFDAIVDEGKMTQLESFDDLALAREMCLEYYNEGRHLGLRPERLEMLRMKVAEIDALTAAANPPATAGGPGMGAPLAPPQALTPSDLVPQAAPPGAAPPMQA